MTRLKSEWISGIEREILVYNDNLKKQLGMDMNQLAAKACGMSEETLAEEIEKHAVAVIPITVGLGVIGSFSESVASIARVMGADVFVTNETDVGGIYEAAMRNADILFMADDDRYIAINVKTGAVGDNNIATARGYVTALEKLAGDLTNKEVLVIGCGIVGQCAIGVLEEIGADTYIYDKDMERVKTRNFQDIKIIHDASHIKDFRYILDATNEGEWLDKEMIKDNAIISTPGVPLSLNKEAYDYYKDNVIHDYLQIGTAVMLGLVL